MPAALTPLLAHLWQKNRPLMLERLALLERCAASPADLSLRKEAIMVAHKLAGSLGMFGFPKGSELARALEVGLEQDKLTPTRQFALLRSLRAVLFPE